MGNMQSDQDSGGGDGDEAGHITSPVGTSNFSPSATHLSTESMATSDEERLIPMQEMRGSHAAKRDDGTGPAGTSRQHQRSSIGGPVERALTAEDGGRSRTSLNGSERDSGRSIGRSSPSGFGRRPSESVPVPSPLHRASVRDPSRRMRQGSAVIQHPHSNTSHRNKEEWQTADAFELDEGGVINHGGGFNGVGESKGSGVIGRDNDRPRLDHNASLGEDSFTSAHSVPQEFIRPRRRHSYVRLPMVTRPVEDDYGVWIHEEELATTWLSLFYDLAVGAVLSAFNGSHDLQSPDGMPSYFAYYTVIMSMWTTQLHYDIRYEADDALHRAFKAVQLMLFVYIGAASGGWNLSAIVWPEYLGSDASNAQMTANGIAAESFLTVAIAVGIHHALLFIQYCIIIHLARKAGRPTRSPQMACWFLVFSTLMVILAAAIPSRSKGLAAAKITFLYASILNDFLSIFFQVLLGVQIPVRWHTMAERYGSLTLIILGQGFSKLTTVFQTSLSGLGQNDTVTYAQVFLVIGIMYDLWFFLFANFRQNVPIDAGRTWLYEIIHFPLHFTMLLLLLGLVNAVNTNSFVYGIDAFSESYYSGLEQVMSGTAASDKLQDITSVISKVGTGIDLTPFVSNIADRLIKSQDSGDERLRTVVDMFGLWTLVVQNACEVPDAVNTRISELLVYNITEDLDLLPPAEAQSKTMEIFTELSTLLIGIEQILKVHMYNGMLWLYPAAGVTLILCALRSMTRYHFKGPAHWILHGSQIGAGVALSLLGLLDIEKWRKTMQADNYTVVMPTISKVVESATTVLIPFLVYTLVVLGTAIWIEALERVPRWRARRRVVRHVGASNGGNSNGVENSVVRHKV